jgi:hypothetical protein
MTNSVLQRVDSIEQVQNDSDAGEIDAQVISQVLNDIDSMKRHRVQQDLCSAHLRWFEQAKLYKSTKNVWVEADAGCSVFQGH